MRIGLDATCWTNQRGYGRYLREMVRALGEVDRANDYVAFVDTEEALQADWPGRFSPRLVPTSAPVVESASASGRRSALDLLRMSRAVASERFDVFWFPTVYSYFPLLKGTPMLLGIHDAMAARNPEWAFASRWNAFLWRVKDRAALKQATRVLTVSNHARTSIASHYRYPADKIEVILEAAAPIFSPPPEPVEREDFLLSVGGLSPNKNLSSLIRAFELSNANRLLIVGDYLSDRFQSSYADLSRQLEGSPARESIEFLGQVSDERLVDLYRRTRAFVMPSLDEGFGLPAVEAMACGAPVIVSAGGALEEVTGEAALTADPRNPAQLAEQIDRVVSSRELTTELSRLSLARSQSFSWEHAATELVLVFERALRA